jgi:hypothetical protein
VRPEAYARRGRKEDDDEGKGKKTERGAYARGGRKKDEEEGRGKKTERGASARGGRKKDEEEGKGTKTERGENYLGYGPHNMLIGREAGGERRGRESAFAMLFDA